MILCIQSFYHKKKIYRITDMASLEPLVNDFPALEHLLIGVESLSEAVENVIAYLNRHHINAWVENSLNKSVDHKTLIMGILAGLLTGTPDANTENMYNKPIPPQTHTIIYDQFGRKPYDGFLWAIKQVESNGGTNVDHKTIQRGLYKGQKAIGRWGLLKTTIDELINRQKMSGILTSDVAILAKMDRDKTHDYLMENPHVELKLVRFLAKHIFQRNNNDIKKAAYAWCHGHNLSADQISDEQIKNSNYVQKFMTFYKQHPYRKYSPTSLQKAYQQEDTKVFVARFQKWVESRSEANSQKVDNNIQLFNAQSAKDKKMSSAEKIKSWLAQLKNKFIK